MHQTHAHSADHRSFCPIARRIGESFLLVGAVIPVWYASCLSALFLLFLPAYLSVCLPVRLHDFPSMAS